MVDPTIVDFVNPERDDDNLWDDLWDNGASTSNATRPEEMTLSRASSDQRVDVVMDNITSLMAFFNDMEDTTPPVAERPGIPSIEKDVGSMMTYPPPTWSMLQENEVLKALQHTVTKEAKKERRKVQVVHQPSKPKASSTNPQPSASRPGTPASLLDKFNNKSFTAVSPQSQPFIPVRSVAPKEPSSIGRDDTMKSPSEIRAEEEIRSTWDRIRDQRPERKPKESK